MHVTLSTAKPHLTFMVLSFLQHFQKWQDFLVCESLRSRQWRHHHQSVDVLGLKTFRDFGEGI